MDQARSRAVPEVDEVLVAPTRVGTQLWELCAEERAIREAMWILGRGAEGGRVGVEGFVKVRIPFSLIGESRGMGKSEGGDEWWRGMGKVVWMC